MKKGTEVSEKTCLDIADKVNASGGFWYAAHSGKEAITDFNDMLCQNLGSGSVVELTVMSSVQHGERFLVKRRYKQSPVVTTTDGMVSALSVSDILPSIEIYGQNEIMDIARDELKIRSVAERLFFIPNELTQNINVAYAALVENNSSISEIEQEIEDTGSSLDELPTTEAKLRYYTKAGLDEGLHLLKKISSEEGQFRAIKKSFPSKVTYPKISTGNYEMQT